MDQPKEITVVYSVKDHEAFKSEWNHIHDLFSVERDVPFRIHGVSRDDEMHRVSLIERAMEKYDDHYDFREVIGDIISCPDLSKWEWPR